MNSLFKAIVALLVVSSVLPLDDQARSRRRNRLGHGASSSLSVLGIDDLNWQGQAKFPADAGAVGTDAGTIDNPFGGLAIRYAYNRESPATIERLYLTVNYSTTANTRIGDLTEWRAPALTTNTIGSANSMIEVRRWHAADLFPKSTDTQWGGVSGWVEGIFWLPSQTDENGGVVIITVGGEYNGADSGHSTIYAVKLSNTMIDSTYATVVQEYGPWSYGTSMSGPTSQWKEVNRGLISIPASAQADLGGKTLAFQGSYTSVSDLDALNFGPNLRGITSFPALASGAPWNSGDNIARGNKIIAHANNDASPHGLAKVAETVTDIGSVEQLSFHVNDGGVIRDWPSSPMTMGSDVNDALYIEIIKNADTGGTVNFWVYMSTPCVGGTKVWEYWNGSSWVDFTSSLTFSVGNANLTTAKTNAVFTSGNSSVLTGFSTSTQNSITDYWVRIRNTATPSTAGAVKFTGMHNPTTSITDYSGQNWYVSVTESHGFAWVETATKHGFVSFARIAHGYVWYGEYHGYKGSTEIAIEDDFAETFDLTGHGLRGQYVNPRFLVYDPMQIRAAGGNGTRDNIGPPTEYNWISKWPNMTYQYFSSAFSDKRYMELFNANNVIWDGSYTAGASHSTANQLLWLQPNSDGGFTAPTIQVFSIS